MNAAHTPQSNDCRMASLTWNLAPSIDPAVPEAVFLKHAASALPAKPAHITATATAAMQENLFISNSRTSHTTTLQDCRRRIRLPMPEAAADEKRRGTLPRGDAAHGKAAANIAA